MYTYKVLLTNVVDGDTIDVDIDLGFGVWMRNQRIRLYGINAPESRTRDLEEKARGLAAKDRLIELLPEQFILQTSLDDRGKFGRILGTILVDEGGVLTNINDLLVEEGHAVEYMK